MQFDTGRNSITSEYIQDAIQQASYDVQFNNLSCEYKMQTLQNFKYIQDAILYTFQVYTRCNPTTFLCSPSK